MRYTDLTLTLQLYHFPYTFAFIVALPGFLALTFPLLFTVATFLLDDFHFTFPYAPFILSFIVPPTYKVTFFLLILGP